MLNPNRRRLQRETDFKDNRGLHKFFRSPVASRGFVGPCNIHRFCTRWFLTCFCSLFQFLLHVLSNYLIICIGTSVCVIGSIKG